MWTEGFRAYRRLAALAVLAVPAASVACRICRWRLERQTSVRVDQGQPPHARGGKIKGRGEPSPPRPVGDVRPFEFLLALFAQFRKGKMPCVPFGFFLGEGHCCRRD